MIRSILAVAGAATAIATGAYAAPPHYRQLTPIIAPDAPWDYAVVDPQTNRLFVGEFGGVLSVDLTTRKATAKFVASKLVHGVAPLPGTRLAAASNGEDNTVTIFDTRTGAVSATVPAGEGPDSITYEPTLKVIAVTNEDGGAVTLIDPRKKVVVGKVSVGGRPEAVVADGRGLLYDNVDSTNEIAVIDPRLGRVVRRYALPRCARPTGLAYDRLRHVLISACRNGVVNVLDAATGRVVTTLQLGTGIDDVMADAKRGAVFVPSGATGELSVLAPDGHGRWNVAQTIKTKAGTRTGAVDPRTGYVYLPAAKLLPSTTPGQPHALVPGSFRILVLAPG